MAAYDQYIYNMSIQYVSLKNWLLTEQKKMLVKCERSDECM